MLASALFPLLLSFLPQTPAAPPAPKDQVAAAQTRIEQAQAATPRDERALADAQRDLGQALSGLRQYPEAVAALREQVALRLLRQEGDKDTVALIAARVELANALRSARQYKEAMAVLDEATPCLERLSAGVETKKREVLRLGVLTARAQICVMTGQNAAARPLLEQALAIALEHLGADAPNTQTVRQSLAVVLLYQGEAERAFQLVADAFAANERVLGIDHPKTVHAASALAQFELQTGRFQEAADHVDLVLRWRRARLGDRHPDTLSALHEQVKSRRMLGDGAGATAAGEELLATMRALVGPDHEDTVDVELQLAELLLEVQRGKDALPMARHVVAQRELDVDGRPGAKISAMLTLARALHSLGQAEEAIDVLQKAKALDDGSQADLARMINHRLAHFLPTVHREQEAMQIARRNLAGFEACLDSYLPVLRDEERLAFVREKRHDFELLLTWSTTPADVAAVYADGLRWKAQVARGLWAQREWLRRNLDAAGAAHLETLQKVNAKLNAAERAGDAKAAACLRAERGRLVDSLPIRARVATPHASIENLAGRLGRGEALVDFFVYEREDRSGAMVGQHLVAFVLTAGNPQPLRIDLGPVAPIADAVQAHVRTSARRGKAMDVASARAADVVGARVRNLVWQPLVAVLAGAERVFVCADGPLALLPFATLPGDRAGTFLLEQHEFVSLVSAHDLLRARHEGTAAASQAGKAVLVGDVDYGQAVRADAFAALPATRGEITAIASVLTRRQLTVATLTGAEATRQRLIDAVRGARFVHLATHGNFSGGAGRGGATRGGAGDESGGGRPGQRGSIALAGANSGDLFTSDEMAWLDLGACELVVLSACDTGLGETAYGEHVLGMRRALRMAGAPITITTTWRIDDVAAAALMADFYERLGSGATASTALRGAQLAQLTKARAAGGDGSPASWGAFLVEGR